MQYLESLRKANNLIAQYASILGPPVYPDQETVMATLERFEQGQSDDSFFFYFNVRDSIIKRVGKNIKPVLGISHLDFASWLGIIHPDFAPIYIEFGFAAYQASLKFKDEIKDSVASYSINLPIKRRYPDGKEEYWLVKQTAYPFEFDGQGNMVSHLNTYTLIGRFQKYAPMQPFVLFDHQNQDLVEAEILRLMQEKVLQLFYPDLAERHRTTLICYWKAFSRYKAKQDDKLPSSASIAKSLGKSPQTIQDYNKAILEASRAAFPLTDFTDMLSVSAFLFDLFGSNGEL